MNRLEFKKANIMVVDDTPGNLELMNDILTERGHEARLIPNGKLALKSAENNPPDIILLDVMMPDMNGYEVCSLLKLNKKTKDIPVIFISAKGETIDKIKAFQNGGVDYITKPFQVDEVLARVETHTSLRRIQMELEMKNNSLEKTLAELEKTQKKLIQTEKMASLGVLSAGIAHEINNPINFVYAGINSLMHDFADIRPVIDEVCSLDPKSDNLKEKIQKIQQLKKDNYFDDAVKAIPEIINDIKVGADRTTEIVKGLRNFSRMDKGVKEFHNLNESLDMALLLLKNKYKNHIEVIKDYGNDLPDLNCYPGKINQAFLNILSNAIDSIAEKGKIWIKTMQEDNELVVSVKDNGSGISEDMKDKIFDPFFTTKPVGKGTGLGLSITYGIINDHNGRIKVDSEAGKGTEFKIYLPVT